MLRLLAAEISLFKEEKVMVRARNKLISLGTTSYYHYVNKGIYDLLMLDHADRLGHVADLLGRCFINGL